jgi:hypothetical protein
MTPAAAHLDVVIAIRTVIALVFLSAAIGKVRHWLAFRGVIANYRLLPDAWILPVSYFLPAAELMVGAALLGGLRSPWPQLAGGLLLALFAAAMAINLLRGRRHIDCGCFQSAMKQTLRWALVARNGGMILLLGAAAMMSGGEADWWTALTGGLAGGALFIVLQCLNTLWAIAPAWRGGKTGVPLGSKS